MSTITVTQIRELEKELKQDIQWLEAEIQLRKLDGQRKEIALLLLNHCKELTKLIEEQLCDENDRLCDHFC